MKKLLTLLLVAVSLSAISQTTINPDTVCANATGEQYFVTNTPTSTYNWTITGGGGTLQTGQGTNSITVDWGGVSGLFPNAVEVIETNSTNCPGVPVLLDVFIFVVFISIVENCGLILFHFFFIHNKKRLLLLTAV